MRKKLLTVLLIGATLVFSAGMTLAWFNAQATANNFLTTAGLDIKINEYMLANGELVDYEPSEIPLLPGDTLSKVVKVENTDSSEAYIRVFVDVSFTDETLDGSVIQINYNAADWELGADGFYYYKQALAPGQLTSLLFDSVTFSSSAGNSYKNAAFNINITAHAVQTANNGTGYSDAVGWPSL